MKQNRGSRISVNTRRKKAAAEIKSHTFSITVIALARDQIYFLKFITDIKNLKIKMLRVNDSVPSFSNFINGWIIIAHL